MGLPAREPSAADLSHGYRFGCEGFIKRQDAAEFLALSIRKIDYLLEEGVLRKRKDGAKKNSPVRICRRSMLEYAASLEY